MTMIQYLNAFRTFSVDVLLLALGVTLVTSLFKKTVFKNCSRKLFVFLPFVLGAVFYAAYRCIATLSILPFTAELCKTFEGGFACGCAATLYYVVYEQFFRTGKTEQPSALPSALSPLLQGFVSDAYRAEAAEMLQTGGKGKTDEELLSFVRETLAAYALPETTPEELTALTCLVADYLKQLPL